MGRKDGGGSHDSKQNALREGSKVYQPAVSAPQHSEDSLLLKFFIGGTACAVTSALLNPFDVCKIRMQNQGSNVDPRYASMRRAIVSIVRDEGVAGLGRGLAASMLRELAYSSIRIGAYEPIRGVLSGNEDSRANPIVKWLSALLSGGLGSALANPTDLVKTRFQAWLPNQPPPYPNTFAAFYIIGKTEGLKGLYRGVGPTVVRAAILTSSQLGSYDVIKNNMFMQYFGMEDGLLLHLYSAMLAGLVTTTATNPVDVIKTRYMSDSKGLYRSPVHCFTHTLRLEGPGAFFKGWMPSYWRLGPHTIISFLLMEKMRVLLGMKTI